MRNIFYYYIFTALLFLLVPFCCSAETIGDYGDSTELIDCSENLEAYAQAVASKNRSIDLLQSGRKTGRKRFTGNATVLCKTDGRELGIVPDGLEYGIIGPDSCYTLYYTSVKSAESAVNLYNTQEGVLYAETDAEVIASETSVSFHSWGAQEMQFDSYLDYTYTWGTSQIQVAVIDSGVCRHTMILPKISEWGYDYIDADTDPSNDGMGHGTHVTGIVADCTQGAPVSIYPIRVLDDTGHGTVSNMVNAISEAKNNGVDVINLSIETQRISAALDTAVLDAMNSGIVVVVSAGNSNIDAARISPSHLTEEGVIVVGSAEMDGNGYTKASYSNYGSSVDVYTFGSNISSCYGTDGYILNSGTSMAAPHISALCALIKLIHPELLPAQTENRITEGCIQSGAMKIPQLNRLIPASEGFRLTNLIMRVSEELQLPREARPLTAQEAIQFTCQDPSIVTVTDGKLTALKQGTTTITATCMGFVPVSFQVSVVTTGENPNSIILPVFLEELGDEAFLGNEEMETVILPSGVISIGDRVFDNCDNLRRIEIGDAVTEIGENTFSEAVILCTEDSFASTYVEENGCQYILNDN